MKDLKRLRGEISHQWNHFTAEDLDRIENHNDGLVVQLQQRYGFAKQRAEREVELFFDDYEARLRRAAA